MAFRFLQKRDEAEDAVQETFIRLWNKQQDLDRYISLEALSTTTLKNYCIDQLRKRKNILIEDKDNHTGIRDNGPTPSEKMESAEIKVIINSIIQRLPEIYRNIIIMKEIEELSYDEIVEITGENINTLRVNLTRARKMIRHEFKKYRYEYTGNQRSS